MSHTYRWPYSPKHQAISYEPSVSGVVLRVYATPDKPAFGSNAMVPGVPTDPHPYCVGVYSQFQELLLQ